MTMNGVRTFESFTDDDFRNTMLRALRLIAVASLLVLPLLAWKLGWKSAALFGVGAAISASGLWEWLRLMTAIMARMDAGGKPRPVTWVLVGFFGRLGLVLLVLYGSLKLLNGSVFALVGGLALGMFALTIEGLRLVKAWTV